MAAMTKERNLTQPMWGRGAAARAVGITYRQLDYWEREGMMTSTCPPLGSGSRARLDADCIKAVGVLAALVPHTIATPANYTPKVHPPTWDEIREAVEAGGAYQLNPRTGAFGPVAAHDADCLIVVNIDRITERVAAALALEDTVPEPAPWLIPRGKLRV